MATEVNFYHLTKSSLEDALPRLLLERGFTLRAVSHTGVSPLAAGGIDALSARLLRSGRPVELLATRERV